MKTIDNFLLPNVFESTFREITSPNFAWFYQASQTKNKGQKDDPYFSHLFYSDNQPRSGYYDNIMKPLLFSLDNVKSLMFARANLYVKKHEPYMSCYHTDDADGENKYNHKTAIFYINTNNGYTEFERGEKVDSVQNKIVIFDASLKHRAVSQTDQDRRILININYIEK